ncbi:MAG: hypothetical protein UT54_C0067G0020 [Candidatus Daviesbacteria bacterium GW2011_GWB1_39_5]|uniref:Uncharacterized protein n=1 Tax=Candidatus Daviesbacteria bacterium GW2011_GWC2_40_12 TaxID=1618431 RepID=A0A0G0QQ98_9BACT|nr:MAG: hypothetical protein UT54_C0067G0020 [Candidatus Daviesbacteria bacterium GW2011_GWB1_39_5]KKR42303.1 MAG: hypothetical protein UT77_C0003G0098 [Candidatus Daviesbacteria bacterium GW2011_GWC2_40_12]
MPNIIYQKHKDLFDFNEELRKIVDSVMNKEFHKITPKVALSTFMFGKAYKTHGAILFLCAQGYGEDAAILTRSLFDLSITLLYILKDPTNKRVLRYFHYDSIIRKKMYDYAKTVPTFAKLFEERKLHPKPGDTTIEEVEKYAKLVQEKHNYGRMGWSDKPIRQMAEEIGREGAYQTVYYLQSNITHSAVRTMNDYVKAHDKGYTVDIGRSESWVEEDLIASFDFFLTIVERSNKLLKLGIAKQLNNLSKRYLGEVGRVNKEASKLDL